MCTQSDISRNIWPAEEATRTAHQQQSYLGNIVHPFVCYFMWQYFVLLLGFLGCIARGASPDGAKRWGGSELTEMEILGSKLMKFQIFWDF